jgi:hypothetical protein
VSKDSFAEMSRLLTVRRLGVCAGISAWNATQVFVYWKLAPALAAGNTVSFSEALSSGDADVYILSASSKRPRNRHWEPWRLVRWSSKRAFLRA